MMRSKMKKLLSLLLILMLFITAIPPVGNVKAAETFYIYVWVVDEKGNTYSNWNYEPGFMGDAAPSHEHTNKFGTALISISKTSNNNYRYYVFGTAAENYEVCQDNFKITEPFTIVKINLAKKGKGTTTSTVIAPGSKDYPKDPLNPLGVPENKVSIHGFVKNASGGILNATVTIVEPTKPEVVYSKSTTTDANGYYCLADVDEKKFSTYEISATKDNVKIPTTIPNKETYMASGFQTLDANASYDFGTVNATPTYGVSITGGTASPSVAPAGTKINIIADTPAQKKFEHWTSSSADVSFENASIASTSFTMPNHAVSIQANYSDIQVENPPDETVPDQSTPGGGGAGGNGSGGDASGGNTSGGTVPEQGTPGGNTSGGNTSGGTVPEQGAPGGGSAGGSTPGGMAPGQTTTPGSENTSTETPSEDGPVQAEGVTLNRKKVTLLPGKKVTLTAKKNPVTADNSVRWSTSNKKVATVNSKGRVTAKKAGTATITVKTSNGKAATCKVVVPGVKLKYSSASIKKGKTAAIKVKSVVVKGDKVAAYKTSNKKVAPVSKKGVVKGMRKGTAKITVTMKSGAKTTFTIKVK